MKYDCVNGGELFSFHIPKISTRDVRLLEKSDRQRGELFPEAEQNLRAVQTKCRSLATSFGVSFSTAFCLRSQTVCVRIFLPLWELRREEWGALQKLRPHLTGIRAYPFRLGLEIIFYIKYFTGQASDIEKDFEEIYQRYTDK